MRITLFLSIIICLRFQITSAQKPELWGMTSQGGIQDYGSIFKINADGTGFWKVHDFGVKNAGQGPKYMSPLLYQGWLYGVTSEGGSGLGVLFKYHPGENRYMPLHFFSYDEGSNPSGSLMLASNGKMYGVLDGYEGALYEFDPTTEQVIVKFHFNSATGNHPASKLIEKDGYLYGITRYGTPGHYAALYRFSLSSETYELLHDFSYIDGSIGSCDLLLASDGKFYGVALTCGNNNNGTLFSFDPSNNSFAVVHHFNGLDGSYPDGNLIEFTNGKIIGTTIIGGAQNWGTIFEYNISNGTFNTMYNFGGSLIQPSSFLNIQSDGWVYSTTTYPANGSNPSVFRFYPDSIAPQQLAQFSTQDFFSANSFPLSGLADGGDGWLYSCTSSGGSTENGTLFRFNPGSFELEKLLDFNENDCLYPFGSLTVSPNGKLYGIGGRSTYFNSPYTLNHPLPSDYQYSMFEIDPLTGSFKKVAPEPQYTIGYSGMNSLTVADQQVYGISDYYGSVKVFRYDPVNDTSEVFLNLYNEIGPVDGNLIQAGNGLLYGLSANGGPGNEGGTIFKIDPVNKTFAHVFEFQENVTGNAPHGSLLQGSDGLLYGMTKNFGPDSTYGGTIFRYDIAMDTFKKLYDFADTLNGKFPLGNLIEGTDGFLYGMTPKGGNFGYGVIFCFNRTTNQFTKLWDFNGELAGGSPQGSLMQASNGEMYGMTLRGGLNDKGVVFAFDPDLLLYEVIENFTVNEKGALPYGNLVEYHGPASVIYTMPDTAACLGSDFTLLAIATGGYLHHEWYHDGIAVGGDAKGLPLTSVTFADSGKYWCNIYNDLGNVVSDTIHLEVIEPPVASLSFTGADVLCPYDAPVELVGSPAGGVYSGQGVIGNAFYPSYAALGIHYPLYTYSYGCVSSDSVAITVASIPQITFTSSGDTSLCVSDPLLILAATPAGGSFSGDGVNGNSFNPFLAGIGTHFIYYTYADTCTATDSISVIVNSCNGITDLSIKGFSVEPNPFTDVLKVSIPEATMKADAHFKIIDNLGKVVADGKISSATFYIYRNQLAAGLYLLVIEAEETQHWKKIMIE